MEPSTCCESRPRGCRAPERAARPQPRVAGRPQHPGGGTGSPCRRRTSCRTRELRRGGCSRERPWPCTRMGAPKSNDRIRLDRSLVSPEYWLRGMITLCMRSVADSLPKPRDMLLAAESGVTGSADIEMNKSGKLRGRQSMRLSRPLLVRTWSSGGRLPQSTVLRVRQVSAEEGGRHSTKTNPGRSREP